MPGVSRYRDKGIENYTPYLISDMDIFAVLDSGEAAEKIRRKTPYEPRWYHGNKLSVLYGWKVFLFLKFTG